MDILNGQLTGTTLELDLFTESKPCPSYQKVIEQFSTNFLQNFGLIINIHPFFVTEVV